MYNDKEIAALFRRVQALEWEVASLKQKSDELEKTQLEQRSILLPLMPFGPRFGEQL